MLKTSINAVIMLDVGNFVLMASNEERELSFPILKIENEQSIIEEIVEGFERKTGIILLNPQNCGTVFKQISEDEKEIYILFKSTHSLGAVSKTQKNILWVKKHKLEGKELPVDMEIYMNIFDGKFLGCHVTYLDDFAPRYVEKRSICKINKYQIPECVKVIRESFMTVASEFALTEENASRFTAFATTEDSLNWQIEYENRKMIAYYEDMRIVGYYSLLIMPNGECELNNLCVLPEYRGSGIGSRLLEHSFALATEEGCDVMNICIINENATLKHWYLINGFVQTRIEKYDFLPFYCAYLKKEL